MAITLVGAQSNHAASGTAITVTAPGGTTGDRLYVVVHVNSETNTVTDNNGGTPTTFKAYYTGGGYTARFAIFTRELGGSEPASYAYTLGSSNRWAIVAFTLRGMHASNLFEADPAFGNFYGGGGTVNDIVCPGVTTTADLCWAFAVAGLDSASANFDGFPSGWTDVATWAGGGQQPLSVYRKEITPAGSTGDATFSKNSDAENAATMTVFRVAPAAAAATPTGSGLLLAGLRNRLVRAA